MKDEKSCEFKTSARAPDRVRDYLRGMIIVLDNDPKKTSAKSLNRLGDIMADLNDFDSHGIVSRKNNFYEPKSNGYRSHKSGWIVDAGGEKHILAELKIEHAAQQNVNLMTRRFMSISRSVRDAMEEYYVRCASGDHSDDKNLHANMKRMQQRIDHIDAFSSAIYAHVHAVSGLDKFLDQRLQKDYGPMELPALQKLAHEAVEAFPQIAQGMGHAKLDALLRPHVPGQKFERILV